MVPMGRRAAAAAGFHSSALLRGGVSRPVRSKRETDFNSDDPWETPFGRIEHDDEEIPITRTVYLPARPTEWGTEIVWHMILFVTFTWMMVILGYVNPKSRLDDVAMEEALRRRRLLREKQEWDILGVPDFDPTVGRQ